MELTYQEHGLPFKGTIISVRHTEQEMTWHILYVLWYEKLPVLGECYWSHTIPHCLLRQNSHETDVQVRRSHYGPCEVEIIPRLLHAANNIDLHRQVRFFEELVRTCGEDPNLSRFFFTELRNLGDWSLLSISTTVCTTQGYRKSASTYESIGSKSKMQPPSREWPCFFTSTSRHVSREKKNL